MFSYDSTELVVFHTATRGRLIYPSVAAKTTTVGVAFWVYGDILEDVLLLQTTHCILNDRAFVKHFS